MMLLMMMQPQRLTQVVEYSNLIFSFLFAIEMLLKIVSDGPFGYIRDGFNVFDGFIVVLRSVVSILDHLSSRLSCYY